MNETILNLKVNKYIDSQGNTKYWWRIEDTEYFSAMYFDSAEACAKDLLTRSLQSLGNELKL